MNSQYRSGALSLYLTAPISELGGSIILIGGCSDHFPEPNGITGIREYIVIFPGSERPMIASRIWDSFKGKNLPTSHWGKQEAERLRKLAASKLHAWARSNHPHLSDELRDATREGATVNHNDLRELHVLGEIGNAFYSLDEQSELEALRTTVSEIKRLRRNSHDQCENFQDRSA